MSRAKTNGLRVLIADDDKASLLLLRSLLQKQGYVVTAVENGRAAVDAFGAERCDLVLLDVSMPVMDGYQAAREIKQAAGEAFVPIVFLTALTDDEDLAGCIEAGGDDFLTKPYSRVILQAKIDALLRTRELYQTVQAQRDELCAHQQRIDEEQGLAEDILNKLIMPRSETISNINYLLRPSSFFNGDIVLVARGPTGSINVMLGDFTGHGLSAAVGSVPAAGVFYDMTGKGYGIRDIIGSVNRKLYELLPTNVFCAAAFVSFDPMRNSLSLWNGGLPDVLVIDESGQVTHRCVSRHLPLGIAPPRQLELALDYLEVRPENRVLLFSDGLAELETDDGMLKQEGIEEVLRQNGAAGFDRLNEIVLTHGGQHGQTDDIALLELICAVPDEAVAESARAHERVPRPVSDGEWRMLVELDGPLLREVDILPVVLDGLACIPGIADHRANVYSVLSELCNNAIDHGLLRLDSSLKNSHAGFTRYYELREQALANLGDGRMVLDCRHTPEPGGGCLVVAIEDSGTGFDVDTALGRLPADEALAGRGLKLVSSVCDSLAFFDGGSRVEAVFRWRSP